jgi:hypothetical protein
MLSRIGFRLSDWCDDAGGSVKPCKERLETIIGQLKDRRSFRRLKPATAYEVCVSRLVDCPRTRDEDVQESSGALLTVRTGRHVGDADKGSEQVEWLQIFPRSTPGSARLKLGNRLSLRIVAVEPMTSTAGSDVREE